MAKDKSNLITKILLLNVVETKVENLCQKNQTEKKVLYEIKFLKSCNCESTKFPSKVKIIWLILMILVQVPMLTSRKPRCRGVVSSRSGSLVRLREQSRLERNFVDFRMARVSLERNGRNERTPFD